MSEDEYHKAAIIDNGSYLIKAGVTDEDAKVVFRTTIGRPKLSGRGSDPVFGREEKSVGQPLSIKYPINHGIITDFDSMEQMWKYTLESRLCVDTSETPVVLTEPVMNPKQNREKTAQIMFETFDVPKLYLGNQGLLSLYAVGLQTGLVLDVGAGLFQTVPIYEGFRFREAWLRHDFGGNDVDQFMEELLRIRDPTLRIKMETIRSLKEKICYVASDYEGEKKKAISSLEDRYVFPSGEEIVLDKERFKAPECLFQPSLTGKDVIGIHSAVLESIKKCDSEIQKDLFDNIVLCGGSSKFRGLKERLEAEIRAAVPSTTKVKVITPKQDPQYLPFAGASLLTSITGGFAQFMTNDEYAEYGPSVVDLKH